MIIMRFFSLLKDESGATAIEYGLITALVSVAAIATLKVLGGSANRIGGAIPAQRTKPEYSLVTSLRTLIGRHIRPRKRRVKCFAPC